MNTPADFQTRTLLPSGAVLREGNLADIDVIVGIHKAAFRGFLMTELGSSFLRVYYRTVIEYPHCIVRIILLDRRAVGFVAGFIDPPGFYASLKSQRIRLGLAIARRLVYRPWLLGRVLADYRRTGTNASLPDHDSAELASIAVLPEYSGRSIGRTLVNEFSRVAVEKGAKSVTLTTDAKNNDRVNRLYVQCGFRLRRTLNVKERLLN